MTPWVWRGVLFVALCIGMVTASLVVEEVTATQSHAELESETACSVSTECFTFALVGVSHTGNGTTLTFRVTNECEQNVGYVAIGTNDWERVAPAGGSTYSGELGEYDVEWTTNSGNPGFVSIKFESAVEGYHGGVSDRFDVTVDSLDPTVPIPLQAKAGPDTVTTHLELNEACDLEPEPTSTSTPSSTATQTATVSPTPPPQSTATNPATATATVSPTPSPSSTATNTPEAPGAQTPTPAPTSRNTRVFVPLVSRQVLPITNGGFEAGWTGWQHGGELPQTISSSDKHSGQYSALLGNPDWGDGTDGTIPVGSAWVEQQVYVQEQDDVQLRFWYRFVSYDVLFGETSQRVWDTLDVTIDGTLIHRDGSPEDPGVRYDTGWKQVTLDLSPYRGTVVTLRVAVFNREYDGNGMDAYNSWAFVDDVSIGP